MNTWKILEIILKKPLEEIIDISTGNWKCKPCKDKEKFISKKSIYEALKEKMKEKDVNL